MGESWGAENGVDGGELKKGSRGWWRKEIVRENEKGIMYESEWGGGRGRVVDGGGRKMGPLRGLIRDNKKYMVTG